MMSPETKAAFIAEIEALIKTEWGFDEFKLKGIAHDKAISDLYDTQSAQKTFDNLFSKAGLYQKESGVREDPELNQYSGYGFIIDREGRIFHILHQYCHGTMLAVLEPEEALRSGYFAPRKDPDFDVLSVFDYQEFEFEAANRLGYLRFGCGFYNRLSFDKDVLNEKHVASLKKWFYNNDMLEEKLISDWMEECSCQKMVVKLDALAQHNKVNNIVYKDFSDE